MMKDIIINNLERLKTIHLKEGDKFRALAYTKALKELKLLPEINTIDDVKGIKGIGKNILEKIKEILETGKLEILKDVKNTNKITQELLQVHGIGQQKVIELIEKHNISSIEDLKEKIKTDNTLLNDVQMKGLLYVDFFQKRIPRKEMEKHNEYITTLVKSIDPKLNATIVGSYRRGLTDSGDIDVLINHEDDIEDNILIYKKIIDTFKKDKYIIETFASGNKKFMGVSKLKRHKSFRRLDLLYTNNNEYPFSLMYFTGSGAFNILIRNIAISQGYSLSEHGLKYLSGDKKGYFVEGDFKTEEDVFKFLGLKYIEPKDREKIKDLSQLEKYKI